jgi:addiction module HigA family antidote
MYTSQHNPPHPGEVLFELDMQPAGISINAVAQKIGVDRKTISRIVNGHASISTEMAILLGKAFNTTPELWLNMQYNYDLWHAAKQMKPRMRNIKAFATSEASAII